jgi:hypothetical protein
MPIVDDSRHPAGYAGTMWEAMPAPVPDMEALATDVTDLLESAPVGDALRAPQPIDR